MQNSFKILEKVGDGLEQVVEKWKVEKLEKVKMNDKNKHKNLTKNRER